MKQIETALTQIYTDQIQTLRAHRPMQIACSSISAIYRRSNVCLNPLKLLKSNLRRNTLPILHSVVAAAFLIAVLLTALQVPRPARIEKYNQVLSTELELPLSSRHHYETVLLNVSSVSETHSRQLKRRKKRERPSIVRRFVMSPRSAPYRSTQIAALEPPRCCEGGGDANDSLPLFLQSEPELPEIRPRRSRFVRIMARVSTPFRYIASR